MNFNINKNLPISIKEQLKGQIRGMIKSCTLQPGQSLPSCNDMSSILSINRNTVAAVYSELCSEGILVSNRGAGTTVSTVDSLRTSNTLKTIIDDAFTQAKGLGYSMEEITDQVLSSLAKQPPSANKRILMVWCNDMTSKEVGERLESELRVTAKSLLVSEILESPDLAKKALNGTDLVVTSLNYIETILPIAEKQGVEVAGIILTPVSRVLNEIVRMPIGTCIGFVSVNDLAAKSMCKGVLLTGMVHLKTTWAGAENLNRLEKIIEDCDVIFATHHVFEQVKSISPQNTRIINMDSSISDSSIEMIKERLAHLDS